MDLDVAAPRDDHRADSGRDLMPLRHGGGGAQIFDPAVCARADEHAVDLHFRKRRSRLEAHVFEGSGRGLAFGLVLHARRIGNVRGHRRDLAWVRPPGHLRRNVLGLEDQRPIELRTGIGRQLFPTGDGLVELSPLRRELTTFQVGERLFVRRNHARAGTGLDGHVADRHPLFHREITNRFARVFDAIAGAAVGRDLADDVENQILRRHAVGQLAVDADLERLGLRLEQGLRRENVLNFARADAERQRAERAVRRRVAVAADDRHAGLRQAQLGTDDVNDPLLGVVQIVELDAEFLAVVPQRVDLLLRNRVGDRQAAVGRRHVVVRHGRRQGRAADLAARDPQSFERLGTGHFVNQMAIDVQNRRLVRFVDDDVLIPNLGEQRARGGRGGGGGHAKKTLLGLGTATSADFFSATLRPTGSVGQARRRNSSGRQTCRRCTPGRLEVPAGSRVGRPNIL